MDIYGDPEVETNTDDEFLNAENKYGKIAFIVIFGVTALCFLTIIAGGLLKILGG